MQSGSAVPELSKAADWYCERFDDGLEQVTGSHQARTLARIVHVSGDFPDPIDAFKTPVIRELVDLTRAKFDHFVFSINRRSPRLTSLALRMVSGSERLEAKTRSEPFEYGTALTYDAPARGVLHATMLRSLGDRIAAAVLKHGGADLLVGHKLSIEGIAVRRAALLLDLPYAICIQGDTDTKILAMRPDLRKELGKVYQGAAQVFPFAPWAAKACDDLLGKRAGAEDLLPCPTDLDTPVPPLDGGNGLISVFHLKNYRRKNLAGMISAMRLLAEAGQPPSLSIIGGGDARDRTRCERLAAGMDTVRFVGPMDRSALKKQMNAASALVLPSLRESFGLVFIEALFAGLPVIYPRGAAIDGYFDGLSFAIPVEATSTEAIALAMETAIRDEVRLKADLRLWQTSEHARQFTRGAVASKFGNGLEACLA